MNPNDIVSLIANFITIVVGIGTIVTAIFAFVSYKSDSKSNYYYQGNIFYVIIKKETAINQGGTTRPNVGQSDTDPLPTMIVYFLIAVIMVWLYLHFQIYIFLIVSLFLVFLFIRPIMYFLVHPHFKSKLRFGFSIAFLAICEAYLYYIWYFPSSSDTYYIFKKNVQQIQLNGILKNIGTLTFYHGKDFVNTIFAIASLIIFLLVFLNPLINWIIAKFRKQIYQIDYKYSILFLILSLLFSFVLPPLFQFSLHLS